MKSRSKVIVGSALSIAMCASLATGATFALFTSESSVNVAITSAKVNVVAGVDKDSIETKNLNADYAKGGNHLAYGKAEPDKKTGALELNNFVPGDGVKFQLTVENASSIEVQYRTVLKIDGDEDLVSQLKVSYNNEELAETFDGLAEYTNWTTLAAETSPVAVPVVVEFPEADDNNAAQGKNCTVSYKVEAVQGNATVTDEEATLIHEGETSFMSLREAFENAQLNDTVKLNKDLVLKEQLNLSQDALTGFTLNGENHTVTLRTFSNNAFMFGDVDSDDHPTGKRANNITVENLTLKGTARTAIQFTGNNTTMSTLKNVKISGQYKFATVNYFSLGGGVLDHCNISNGAEKCVYGSYGYDNPYGIFANRAANEVGDGAVKLINGTYVDTIIVNESKTTYEYAKLIMDDTSEVDVLFADYRKELFNEQITKPIVKDNDFSNINEFRRVVSVGFYQDMKATQAENKEVYVVTNAQGLAYFRNLVNNGDTFEGKIVTLKNDIDLSGIKWTPIGVADYDKTKPSGNVTGGVTFEGTFNGNGHTISNLTYEGDAKHSAGLFGFVRNANISNFKLKNAKFNNAPYVGGVAGVAYQNTIIENVEVDGLTLTNGIRQSGGIVGYANNEGKTETGLTINQCKVLNSNLQLVPENVKDDGTVQYDNGDKLGGILGYQQNKVKITGCEVENVTLTAYRDIGGIAGMFCNRLAEGVVVNGNRVSGLTMVLADTNGYNKPMEERKKGEIYGRLDNLSGAAENSYVITENTVNGVEVSN